MKRQTFPRKFFIISERFPPTHPSTLGLSHLGEGVVLDSGAEIRFPVLPLQNPFAWLDKSTPLSPLVSRYKRGGEPLWPSAGEHHEILWRIESGMMIYCSTMIGLMVLSAVVNPST
jgi:hypothetical protein